MLARPDRLSALDASFLDLEDDVSHMHIGSVGIFEGPAPPHDDLLAKVGSKLPQVPRYRQVVKRVPGNLGRPVWVDDQHFNLEYHVRRTALPAPGGEVELRRLVGRLMSQQLDRKRPLWEIWFVEGLEDGRWASVCKTHHCLVDGVSGTELLAAIMDLSPESEIREADDGWSPTPAPSGAELITMSGLDLIAAPRNRVRAALDSRLLSSNTAMEALAVLRGVASYAGLARPTEPSTLNGPIGPHRRWAWAATSVADVKTVRHALGGTFNDVVLAAITTGFRELLQSRGESTQRTLRTMVPVSVRARDASGLAVGDSTYNNKVSAMFAELPVAVSNPVERLHVITRQMEGLKESAEALAGEALTSLAGFAPPLLLGLGLRIASKVPQRNFNTVTTNVPGPQLPLYMHGRRMLKAYPYVPLWGQVRVTIAIFSYDGQVNFGVTGDYDTAADIDVLCQGIEHGMQELLRCARPRGVRGAARANAADSKGAKPQVRRSGARTSQRALRRADAPRT